MEQNRISNNTLSEEDKILTVRQGGTLIWDAYEFPYFGFSIEPAEHKQQYRQDIMEEFFEIGYDIIRYFSENRVIRTMSSYEKKEKEYYSKKSKKYVEPVFTEGGKVDEFKQYLITSDRKDLIWADYMYYVTHITDSILLRLLSTKELRSYARDIQILQENLDIELLKMAAKANFENDEEETLVFVYPHSKIQHSKTDKETVIKYVHDEDFMVYICLGVCYARLLIKPNPRYITYDQLLKEIEPIFNKYGWEYGDMTNPYLKAFGCNVNCNNCDSYCYYNFNPDKKLSEPRINRKNPKPTSKGLTSRGDVWY